MTKVLVLSDLHLDHSHFTPNLQDTDILVLAGDIAGRNSLLESFLQYYVPEEIPVIFVAGNHEYEHHDFHRKNEYLKSLSNEFNFHALYNESITMNGIRFIGTPLFSNLKGFYQKYFPGSLRADKVDQKLKEWCMTNISDFKYIYNTASLGQENRWTIDDMLQEFETAYDFIKKELSKEHKDGKTVVVTHFSPLMDSASSKYGINDCQSYWCNHIPELVQQADFWIHGHVHRPQIYMEGQCKVICNPRGYSEFSGLAQESTFLPTYKFEV